MCDGDTVLAHSLDRLARNLDDLRRIVRELTGRGAGSSPHRAAPFTGEDTPTATLLLSVMGAFAELERTLIRQREGIALARQRGAYRGRRKSLTDAQDRPPSAPSGNRKPCWPRNSVSAVRPSTKYLRNGPTEDSTR